MKNIIISGLVGAIVLFILGFLFYAVLFMDFFENHAPPGMEGVMKEMPNLGLVFAGNLALGLMLAYVFEKLASIRTFSKGLYVGFVLGLLISLYFDLIFLGTSNFMSSTTIAVDVVISTVIIGLSAAVVAMILGKISKT